MCGFCGMAGSDIAPATAATWVSDGMQSLAARGPDDAGHWHDDERGLHLGFRRLSVIDTSSAGHQPMVSSDGRAVLVFNGEIYNHRELRRQLIAKGSCFQSHSDTEVLLEALRHWGADALERLNGMFALAYVEPEAKRVLLARDHAGIKPLWFSVRSDGRAISFASQLDVVTRSPWPLGEIDQEALNLYLRLHYLPQPYGMHRRVQQLGPGEWVQFDRSGLQPRQRWWTLGGTSPDRIAAPEVPDALADALTSAIGRQMVADVPVGTFLSGGVDSPLVTAVASGVTTQQLRSFTIASPGWPQDEGPDAAAFAEALGVVETTLEVGATDITHAFDSAVAAMTEPMGDFSILPTALVSEMAHDFVTVSLSGDGGDELFFGYERPWSLMRDARLWHLPPAVRRARHRLGRLPAMRSVSGSVAHQDPGAFYEAVNGRIDEGTLRSLVPSLLRRAPGFDLYRFTGPADELALADFSRRVEFYGQLQKVLRKVDMASMAHSLEVRVPLLDREIIDLSLRIDPLENLRGGERKATLRDQLARHVPRSMISPDKRGFAIPLGEWLSGPLRPQVEGMLFDSPLYPGDLFDRDALHRLWSDHCAGKTDAKWAIWTILSLQIWAHRVGRPA